MNEQWTKYKLYRHDAKMYKDWWVFPLAVQIQFNDMIYMDKNFAITVHFLCFHVRWLFMEVEKSSELDKTRKELEKEQEAADGKD